MTTPIAEENSEYGKREEVKHSLLMRYARQIAIPGFGIESQQKLLHSSVLIIGCGALGSMAGMQLAGAGIGKIMVADFDTVDISNLQRQFFFKTTEAGKSKAAILSKSMQELNPEIEVLSYPGLVTSKILESLIEDFDFVVDATDNPESKLMIGDICRSHLKSCCIGGVRDFSGQVTTELPGKSQFSDIFGRNAEGSGVMPCSLGGVAGPAAALCASVQVSETIKYLTGNGDLLDGKLFYFNMLENIYKVLIF